MDTNVFASPLAGKSAVVTGSARGIGKAIAHALGSAGARVAILARSEEQVTATVSEFADAGIEAIGYSVDLRNPNQVADMSEYVLEQFGGVDILVNNAGNNIKRPTVPLPVSEDEAVGQPGSGPASVGMTDEEWDSILDTHVRASLQTIRSFVPGMLERRWGRVINIGSSAVGRSPNLVTPYKVGKGALTHLTISLAKEWAAYGVTVNTVAPGHFRTDMSKALHDSPEGQAWLKERIPMGHAGDVRALGGLATYLATDLASYITGQVVYVDGGETL